MSVDAGIQQILHAYRTGPDGTEAGAEVHGSFEIQVGRLAAALDRQTRLQLQRDQADAQAVAPVDIGPLDYVVTAGQPKFKAHRSYSSDIMSPQEGFFWFVTRVSLAGLNAGDIVNLFRPSASGVNVNAVGVHTFLAPAAVGAGLGIADWEPGALGLILRPDDTLSLVSGGTLAATEIILTGQAIQVSTGYLARYLL